MSASFATMLRRLRTAANLSQEALAEKARISAAAIGAYERGIRAPHRDSIDLLSDALSLSGDTLLEFKVAGRPKPRVRRVFSLDPSAKPASRAIPAEATTFVAREPEIAAITKLLGEQQVVTLTGSGGVGKTRVALRVASRLQRADGVWFVDLGSVRDPSRVVAKILSVVPLPRRDDETADALAESFRERSALLILDNCEHVIEAAGNVVSALVRTAPNVAVLVTSRHRLHISSEFVFRLEPLPYPDSPALTAKEARRYAAVDLFVSRASAADQRFSFSDEHVANVVEICRRVEGIPLALELAAARLPMFGLTALQEKLRDRLGPLKASVRDAPERQQTFRATIDWSYDLLESHERLLLQRLAIFSSGCTLDSAEDVCSDETLARDWISDGVSTLVDRSLISAEIASSVPRYALLETTRQYALEKLSDVERERLSKRHAAWCATFADDLKLATLELTHAEWALTVLPEFDNVYQAIDWTTAHDRLLFARIVGSMYFLWWRIGRLDEGRRLAVDALSQLDEDAHPTVAAQLHLARAVTLTSAERLEATQHVIDLLEGLGEPRGLLEAYIHLGGVYLMVRDRDRLRPVVERIAAIVKSNGERGLSPLISWLRAGVHSLDGELAETRDEL